MSAAAGVGLFASFIGFDSIAQAGGEARRPGRNLPLAIGICVASVGIFYMLFTAAVYHAVPWQFIAAEAQHRDLTAPGLLGYLLPPAWTVLIVSGAAVALIKDLPAMLLGVSRLMFAWAEDGIFPRAIAAVHPRFRTPHVASWRAPSWPPSGSSAATWRRILLGVDILVTSMLVNFLLMAISVLTLPARNAALARKSRCCRRARRRCRSPGRVVVGGFPGVTRGGSDRARSRLVLRSTPLWLVVMAAGSILYRRETQKLRRQGVNLDARFAALPPDRNMTLTVERVALTPDLSISAC